MCAVYAFPDFISICFALTWNYLYFMPYFDTLFVVQTHLLGVCSTSSTPNYVSILVYNRKIFIPHVSAFSEFYFHLFCTHMGHCCASFLSDALLFILVIVQTQTFLFVLLLLFFAHFCFLSLFFFLQLFCFVCFVILSFSVLIF